MNLSGRARIAFIRTPPICCATWTKSEYVKRNKYKHDENHKQRSGMKIKSVGKNTVVISFLAFIGLGMSGGLLGLAWPSMQKQFGLPLDGVTTYFVLSTVAYTLSSFSIGRLMARFGSGTVLLVGSTLVALSLSVMAAANSWGL